MLNLAQYPVIRVAREALMLSNSKSRLLLGVQGATITAIMILFGPYCNRYNLPGHVADRLKFEAVLLSTQD